MNSTQLPRFRTLSDMRRAVGLASCACEDVFVDDFEEIRGRLTPYMAAHRYSFFKVSIALQGPHPQSRTRAGGLELSNSTLFFNSPNNVISWDWRQAPFQRELRGMAVYFTADFLQADLDNALFYQHHPFFQEKLAPFFTLTVAQQAEVWPLFQRLHAEYNSANPDRLEVIRAELRVLLLLVRRYYRAVAPSGLLSANSLTRTVADSRALITKRPPKRARLIDIADELHISPAYLSKALRAETGFSAKHFMDQQVLREAELLLRHTRLTAAEIGYRLGFEEPAHFHRFFQRHKHLTPIQFRQHQ